MYEFNLFVDTSNLLAGAKLVGLGGDSTNVNTNIF